MARELASKDPSLVAGVEEFLNRYAAAIESLSACPRVQRLVGLKAFGIKANPRLFVGVAVGFRPPAHVRPSLHAHDRWVHSQYVAAHGLALTLRLRFSQEECACVVFAGLLHDLGHPAFSHDVDHLLIGNGRLSHEERGMRWVAEDESIMNVLASVGLTPADIIPVMAEEGSLGTIQTLADTLGYLVLDTEVLGIPLGFSFARTLVDAAMGLVEDCIITDQPELFQEFLDIRAIMYRDIYYRRTHGVAATFLCKVIAALFEHSALTFADIEEETEAVIEAKIIRFLQDATTPQWLHSAWAVANAVPAALVDWESRSYRMLAEMAAQPVSPASSVVLQPIDYMRKTLRVWSVVGGAQQVLHAAADLHSPFCQQWHTFTYRGE
ncbi:HD domain-containing protein [Patescibacteria group bacterium]|nr:HD domain-containing protein [Patescibacteria group bacterium]